MEYSTLSDPLKSPDLTGDIPHQSCLTETEPAGVHHQMPPWKPVTHEELIKLNQSQVLEMEASLEWSRNHGTFVTCWLHQEKSSDCCVRGQGQEVALMVSATISRVFVQKQQFHNSRTV